MKMKDNVSRVQILRVALGLTQKELAERSNINIRQIQKYEYGEYDTGKMMLRNAIALADKGFLIFNTSQRADL